jgi:nitrite reductase/ring-hydroxylating ferredoxin subunit
VRDNWPEWPVTRFDDLSVPGARGFLVGDGDWPFRGIVVRQASEVYAYANVCPHQRHALDLVPDDFLAADGRLIRCASHGAMFTLEDGRCVIGPCVGKHLMKLECRVDNGVVLVRAPESLRDAVIDF